MGMKKRGIKGHTSEGHGWEGDMRKGKGEEGGKEGRKEPVRPIKNRSRALWLGKGAILLL